MLKTPHDQFEIRTDSAFFWAKQNFDSGWRKEICKFLSEFGTAKQMSEIYSLCDQYGSHPTGKHWNQLTDSEQNNFVSFIRNNKWIYPVELERHKGAWIGYWLYDEVYLDPLVHFKYFGYFMVKVYKQMTAPQDRGNFLKYHFLSTFQGNRDKFLNLSREILAQFEALLGEAVNSWKVNVSNASGPTQSAFEKSFKDINAYEVFLESCKNCGLIDHSGNLIQKTNSYQIRAMIDVADIKKMLKPDVSTAEKDLPELVEKWFARQYKVTSLKKRKPYYDEVFWSLSNEIRKLYT